jgi:SAM-dependent methyltransferase
MPRRFEARRLTPLWLFLFIRNRNHGGFKLAEARSSVVFLFLGRGASISMRVSVSADGQSWLLLDDRIDLGLMRTTMDSAMCKRAATIKFWDGYATWYKLWVDHTNYYAGIIDVLMAMAEPGWRVLDIGAGNGILSFPLYAKGCDVTALEPSIRMRNLLYEEAFKRGLDRVAVDERIWEEVPCDEFLNYDLIMACNTLHLTKVGLEEAIQKIFGARPENVFLITELGSPEIRVRWCYGEYTMAFTKCYEAESSFAYHHLSEILEHWAFKEGRELYRDEVAEIKRRVVFEDRHLWIKDAACVAMYWWKKITHMNTD